MMRKSSAKQPSSWSRVIRWPVFLAVNLVFMFVIGASTIRETYRGWSVDREIRALEANAASLQGRKLQLQALTEELVSPERVELDARARLGLKKPHERVIIVEGASASSSPAWQNDAPSGSDIARPAPSRELSNPERWRQYFFH